jgi:hypothetical protein
MSFPCLAMPSRCRDWGGRRRTPTIDNIHDEQGLALPSARGGERERRAAALASAHLSLLFPRGGRPPSAGGTGLLPRATPRFTAVGHSNYGRGADGSFVAFPAEVCCCPFLELQMQTGLWHRRNIHTHVVTTLKSERRVDAEAARHGERVTRRVAVTYKTKRRFIPPLTNIQTAGHTSQRHIL